MKPHSWIAAGWTGMAGTVGLGVAGAVQTLGAVGATCLQPLVQGPLVPGQSQSGYLTCPGTGTEFVWGLICAASAGVAFFSGLTCFFWAAHLRRLDLLASQIGSGQSGSGS